MSLESRVTDLASRIAAEFSSCPKTIFVSGVGNQLSPLTWQTLAAWKVPKLRTNSLVDLSFCLGANAGGGAKFFRIRCLQNGQLLFNSNGTGFNAWTFNRKLQNRGALNAQFVTYGNQFASQGSNSQADLILSVDTSQPTDWVLEGQVSGTDWVALRSALVVVYW